MKNILITGGLGFIGTNLILALTESGQYRIRVLDNFENISGTLNHDLIELIKGDIQSVDIVEQAIEGVDAVVHLAADTRVIQSIENPEKNFHVNVIGTFNILQAMRKHNVSTIINASTGGAILGEVEPPVNETMMPNPLSPYGASKLAAEGYLSAYAGSYGIKSMSLRFSNIYGIHSLKKSSVVAAFIKQIVNQGEVTVYGDGSQTRDYLFCGDLAQGIVNAIENPVSGVIQLGKGKPTSINQLIDILKVICSEDGVEFKVINEPFRAGEIKHTYCDISKAEAMIDFSPTTELDLGAKITWNWYKQNYQA